LTIACNNPAGGDPDSAKTKSVPGLAVTPLVGGDGGFRFTVDRSTLSPSAQSFVIMVNNRPIMRPVYFNGSNTKTIDYPFVDAEEEYTFKAAIRDTGGGQSSEVTITALDGLGEIKATNASSLNITVNTSDGYVQMNTVPLMPALISPYANFEYYLRRGNSYSGKSGGYGSTDKVPLAYLMEYGGANYQGQTCYITLECVVRYGEDGEEVEYMGTVAESINFSMPSVTASALSGSITVSNAPTNPARIYINPQISFDDKLWRVGNYEVQNQNTWSGQVWVVGTHTITNISVNVETQDGQKKMFNIPVNPPLSVSLLGGTYSDIPLTVNYQGN
jgi:hypothetical protein